MSWAHLEKNPPWWVRCLARRKVRTKTVVAIGDEEIAIQADMSVDRVREIYSQRTWDNVSLSEIRRFCTACGFDPFSCIDRNRSHAYIRAIKDGRCAGFGYLKRSPWWTTIFNPLITQMRGKSHG